MLMKIPTDKLVIKLEPCTCAEGKNDSPTITDIASIREAGWPICPHCGAGLEAADFGEAPSPVVAILVRGGVVQDAVSSARVDLRVFDCDDAPDNEPRFEAFAEQTGIGFQDFTEEV